MGRPSSGPPSVQCEMVRPVATLSGHLSEHQSASSSAAVMSLHQNHCHRDHHGGMNGELRAGRTTTAKRGSSAPNRCEEDMDRCPDEHCNRVFDSQSVPTSVRSSAPLDPGPVKRPRPPPSSSSSSSSSTAALRMKSRSNNTHTQLKLAELLAIKTELTVIKVQIDGLLDCVEQMDRQRRNCSECVSPHRGSVSSLERESPEPGEASEDEPLHYYHQYYTHRIKQQRSDLEDDL